MPIRATITRQSGVRFEGWAESDHTVTIEGPPEAGGKNEGFRPMELMLLGMAGCMAYDVQMILKRMRQEVIEYTVEVEAERAEQPPRVYTAVKLEHVLKGIDLRASQVQRAIALAESNYCAGTAMFAKTAKVSNTFRIIEG